MTRPLEQTCGPGRDPLSHSVNFSLRCLYCTCFLPEVLCSGTPGGNSQKVVRAGGSMPRLPHSRGGCWGRRQFSGECSEAADSSGNPHFPPLPLCLIFCTVSPVVLGFISQTNSLHPNLCLTIFFGGTQTKIVIYYGQQISSTWATISTPEFLTDMHINHGFFPLDLDNVLDFLSEQQLGIDQY